MSATCTIESGDYIIRPRGLEPSKILGLGPRAAETSPSGGIPIVAHDPGVIPDMVIPSLQINTLPFNDTKIF